MDTIKNIKEMHSSNSNIFILNTNYNEKVVQLLSSKEYISKIWIDDKNNKINIVPNDINSFQLELPKKLQRTI